MQLVWLAHGPLSLQGVACSCSPMMPSQAHRHAVQHPAAAGPTRSPPDSSHLTTVVQQPACSCDLPWPSAGMLCILVPPLWAPTAACPGDGDSMSWIKQRVSLQADASPLPSNSQN